MKMEYENSLQMMFCGDEGLKEIIQKFIGSFPESFKKKIDAKKEKGIVLHNGKRWVFEDLGDELCISVGSESNPNKDYMSLYLKGISNENMRLWPRFDGEKLIGFVVVYMHNKENQKDKPMQVNYDYYAKRNGDLDKIVYMNITTRFNSHFKGNEERLEEYGLNDIHKRVGNRPYKIDTKAIVENRIR